MEDKIDALLDEIRRYRAALEVANRHMYTCNMTHNHWCDEHSEAARVVEAALATPSETVGKDDDASRLLAPSCLDERWSVDPGYSYVKNGAYIWVFAGERKQYESFSVGPTPICQTIPSAARRIAADHNAILDR